jgi:hypothetical protein
MGVLTEQAAPLIGRLKFIMMPMRRKCCKT